jgi:hypothetical protein
MLMSRRLPRSFFWIDQQLVRNGTWVKLGHEARLVYIAISASVDRDGLSIWSRSKLMELSGCRTPEEFQQGIVDLESHRLIEPIPQNVPPAIHLCSLDPTEAETAPRGAGSGRGQHASPPIVVHTTVHIGGDLKNVESGNSG